MQYRRQAALHVSHPHSRKLVQEASRQIPVLLVTGARQVGKTAFLRRVSEPERTYVILDDPLVLALAKSYPPLFSCSVFRRRC